MCATCPARTHTQHFKVLKLLAEECRGGGLYVVQGGSGVSGVWDGAAAKTPQPASLLHLLVVEKETDRLPQVV